jgi:hypothetical protein
MNIYKYWPILDKMPEGWKVDKTCGSPLTGHVFITNSKSVLNGQKRALLLCPERELHLKQKNEISSKASL